jgi:hypothetical protein
MTDNNTSSSPGGKHCSNFSLTHDLREPLEVYIRRLCGLWLELLRGRFVERNTR